MITQSISQFKSPPIVSKSTSSILVHSLFFYKVLSHTFLRLKSIRIFSPESKKEVVIFTICLKNRSGSSIQKAKKLLQDLYPPSKEDSNLHHNDEEHFTNDDDEGSDLVPVILDCNCLILPRRFFSGDLFGQWKIIMRNGARFKSDIAIR